MFSMNTYDVGFIAKYQVFMCSYTLRVKGVDARHAIEAAKEDFAAEFKFPVKDISFSDFTVRKV